MLLRGNASHRGTDVGRRSDVRVFATCTRAPVAIGPGTPFRRRPPVLALSCQLLLLSRGRRWSLGHVTPDSLSFPHQHRAVLSQRGPKSTSTTYSRSLDPHHMQSLNRKQIRLQQLLGTKHVRDTLEDPQTRAVAVSFTVQHLIKHHRTDAPIFHYYRLNDGCETWCP